MTFDIIIMAGGQGKRMHSSIPKVLHHIAGQPMLERVIETAKHLNPEKIHVIIGHGGDIIQKQLAHHPVNWVWQTQQLGTGHAILQALPHIDPHKHVLILSGDVPLIQQDTLQKFISHCQNQQLGLLIANHPSPHGLGRILRVNDKIVAIIEEKDATDEQRKIQEIYTGICYVSAKDLNKWLPLLSNNNAQQEYYLTEILALAVADKQQICSYTVQDLNEVQGVNDRMQLQHLERAWQAKIATKLMSAGVTLGDAQRIDVRGNLQCGKDVFIDINNVFKNNVIIGDNTHIEPNCILNNATIGNNCHILANSVLDNCTIGDNCNIGPFARLRPGTILKDDCKIGNFVETKNATFANNSKASHLSYLGDVTIGSDVNIGAGTITCNYDGVNKHQTIIEDGVFIGSDTQLVAPVTVGKNATIGAGSTIRKHVPADELTLTISTQKTVYGWQRKG